MRPLSRRSTTVVVFTAVALGAAGAAWAAWGLTGSGTAEAKAGSVVTLKVTGAGLAAGGLTPGNATTVLLTVENRNAFPVRITNIDLTKLASSRAGCDAETNVEVVPDAPLPAQATVPAGRADEPATAQIAWSGPLRMKPDPADACQGAPFTFHVHLDAVSAAA
ncbi:hypothetical protein [Couchioplanes azureus]|uniref:hypothetical protein n=1 Tax=Couchioplanes caeruleus TaxID=56438 RepID=UPI00166F7E38|nr:hypothetical protein [Couchioplanes caeruleus]GGQ40457.1 hypothetical protein GCM10010166_04440 [Couchioplanes caeruleus subsp. azureus]